jgi:hypothetical protein
LDVLAVPVPVPVPVPVLAIFLLPERKSSLEADDKELGRTCNWNDAIETVLRVVVENEEPSIAAAFRGTIVDGERTKLRTRGGGGNVVSIRTKTTAAASRWVDRRPLVLTTCTAIVIFELNTMSDFLFQRRALLERERERGVWIVDAFFFLLMMVCGLWFVVCFLSCRMRMKGCGACAARVRRMKRG